MKKIPFTVAILSLSATGINAQNTYECKGFSMTGEGKMICEYLDSYDKKTRHVFANISEDTVVYTVIRENPDKSLDML